MRQKLLGHALIALLVWSTTPFTYAEVVIDNFTVDDLTDDINLDGGLDGDPLTLGGNNIFNILETYGQRHGNNLFHSFLQFNVASTQPFLPKHVRTGGR